MSLRQRAHRAPLENTTHHSEGMRKGSRGTLTIREELLLMIQAKAGILDFLSNRGPILRGSQRDHLSPGKTLEIDPGGILTPATMISMSLMSGSHPTHK